MIIGKFEYDSEADTYTGEVRTLTFCRGEITLRPQTRVNEREPDYRIVGACGDGEVEFGAAWQRRSDKGQEYLSVLLDDPALGGALSAAIFHDKEGGGANLVWSRPPRHAPATDAQPKRTRRGAGQKAQTRAPAQG